MISQKEIIRPVFPQAAPPIFILIYSNAAIFHTESHPPTLRDLRSNMSRRMIALNNHGVNSLRCGRYNDAILSFRHAVQCAKTINTIQHMKDTYCAPEDVVLRRSPLECIEPSRLIDSSPSNAFDVYQAAFYLPKVEAVDYNLPELSVVLLYNIALSHHLAGLVGIEICDSHLLESLHYYKLALTTYRSQSDCTNIDRMAVILGGVTNMGHIFSHFWKLREVKSCYQILDRMLASSQCVSLSEEDADFFYSTLSYCAAQTRNVAPAA